MKILLRIANRPEDSLGHLVRSLHLANILQQTYAGIELHLIVDDITSAQERIGFIPESILEVEDEEEPTLYDATIQVKPNVVFIDKLFHYSAIFVETLRSSSQVLMFHNLCEGAFASNVFIFPAAHIPDEILQDYRWSDKDVALYHGFDFIIINDKVGGLHPRSRQRGVEQVVITTGGRDPKGVLLKVLDWLKFCPLENLSINALIGSNFKHKDELAKLVPTLPEQVNIQPFDYKYLAAADAAISTFGVSTYELLYLQVPVLSIGHAPLNARGSKVLSGKCEAVMDMGLISELGAEDFCKGFEFFLANSTLHGVPNNMIDGKGAERIANIIIQMGRS